MKVPHGPEVAFGENVGVDHEERLGEPVSDQRKRPHRAERARLLEVLDAHTEARPVAQPFPDHLGLVVDRDDDVHQPRLAQALDEQLTQRSPADAQQRLGHRLGKRAKPATLAPRHDHRSIG
jgi:hypothetical protein